MDSEQLLEALFGYNLPIVFDVKAVESVQDTARLVNIYEDDGKLVLEFH